MGAVNNDIWEPTEIGIKIPQLKGLTYFLETYCKEEISELVMKYPHKNSIYIDFRKVIRFSNGLREALENKFEQMSLKLQMALADVDLIQCSIKKINVTKIKFRINEIPTDYKQRLRDLGTKEIGKLVCVDGFARVVTNTESKEVKTAFKCLRCGHITFVEPDGNTSEEPYFCENTTCGKSGPFKKEISLTEFVDFQRIIIQESPDSTRGTKTRDMIIECDEELTNQIEPGERITVIGILTLRQTEKDRKKTVHEKIIKALSIEKQNVGFDDYILTESDEEIIIKLSRDPKIKENIIGSIAPSIHGHDRIKKGLALQLFSGVRKILPDGTTERGNIHAVLIGEPSTSKSQLLRKIVSLIPRGVFSSGQTSSGVGLTASVVRDPLSDGWILQGGAVVIASGGILAIDEIGQIKEEDKSALHEVMEQGTVSIAKAGIVSKLQADCAVLAAGNPKKGYFDRNDKTQHPSEQIGLPPALWSRFDLTFLVLDDPDPIIDKEISNHILRNHLVGGMIQNRLHSKNPIYTEEKVKEAKLEIEAPISEEILTKYIAYARTKVFPVATSLEIRESIQNFYLDIRKMKSADPTSPVPITPRSLGALQRLSEASARMRLSNIISEEDVQFAMEVMRSSLIDLGMDENNRLDANLLNGLPSQSQQEKIECITQTLNTKKGHTEEEVVGLMKSWYKMSEGETRGIIKKLSERGNITNINGLLKYVV
jgi:replicative DNA helicase Mcm